MQSILHLALSESPKDPTLTATKELILDLKSGELFVEPKLCNLHLQKVYYNAIKEFAYALYIKLST